MDNELESVWQDWEQWRKDREKKNNKKEDKMYKEISCIRKCNGGYYVEIVDNNQYITKEEFVCYSLTEINELVARLFKKQEKDVY